MPKDFMPRPVHDFEHFLSRVYNKFKSPETYKVEPQFFEEMGLIVGITIKPHIRPELDELDLFEWMQLLLEHTELRNMEQYIELLQFANWETKTVNIVFEWAFEELGLDYPEALRNPWVEIPRNIITGQHASDSDD